MTLCLSVVLPQALCANRRDHLCLRARTDFGLLEKGPYVVSHGLQLYKGHLTRTFVHSLLHLHRHRSRYQQ